jgi:TetR/AcrR family transcriptional regulator
VDEITKAEEKIFDAAKEEFIERGFDGARMQSIANRAGISKAALHYYYRSKEKLFKKVVSFIFNMVFKAVKQKIEEELPFEEKVHSIISIYIDMVVQHQHMAFFMFSELMKHPQILDELVKKQEKILTLSKAYQAELDKSTIRSVDPRHLILNVVSMCLYPVLGRPLVTRILGFSKTEYDEFLDERKDQVYEFVMKSLRQ